MTTGHQGLGKQKITCLDLGQSTICLEGVEGCVILERKLISFKIMKQKGQYRKKNIEAFHIKMPAGNLV